MKFNHRDFRISDVGGTHVKAVAQFMYKGYEISMSQIFEPSIAIFKDDYICAACISVEAAIEWIEERA